MWNSDVLKRGFMSLFEGKRWILYWTRKISHFPCPTAKVEMGKFIPYAAGDVFFY